MFYYNYYISSALKRSGLLGFVLNADVYSYYSHVAF